MLATEHSELDLLEQKIQQEIVKSQTPDTGEFLPFKTSLHGLLETYRERYLIHFGQEEAILIPLIKKHIPKDVQMVMATEMRERGKISPRGSMALIIFRDAALATPEDEEVWNSSFAWFFRNVVLAGLAATNEDYETFLKLLPN